jgi:Mg2+/Co2+ transporter CorB
MCTWPGTEKLMLGGVGTALTTATLAFVLLLLPPVLPLEAPVLLLETLDLLLVALPEAVLALVELTDSS